MSELRAEMLNLLKEYGIVPAQEPLYSTDYRNYVEEYSLRKYPIEYGDPVPRLEPLNSANLLIELSRRILELEAEVKKLKEGE